MHEIFSEVVREISVRKVEMKIRTKSRLNLFENENSTLFSINSFVHPHEYWLHLNQISIRIRSQVEWNYSQFQDLLESLDFLEFLYSDLRGIRVAYLPDNQDLILGSLQIEGLLKYRNDYAILETLKKKVLYFVEIQKMIVSALEEYLSRKIRSLQNRFRLIHSGMKLPTLSGKRKENDEFEFHNDQVREHLIWNRTDTDLLELTTALYESKAIRSSSGKFNKKHLLQTFEKLFHHTVKGAGSKLTRARDRKTETAVFMEELKTAFSDYVSRKDNDLGSRRN